MKRGDTHKTIVTDIPITAHYAIKLEATRRYVTLNHLLRQILVEWANKITADNNLAGFREGLMTMREAREILKQASEGKKKNGK